MPAFRCIEFKNGASIFLRPADHDAQVQFLFGMILRQETAIEDMTVEQAAAWNYAVCLYHMPVEGTA